MKIKLSIDKSTIKIIARIILVLTVCTLVGAILNYFYVPACWLLGSTIVSIVFSIKKLNVSPSFNVRAFFSIVIGLAIASSIHTDTFYKELSGKVIFSILFMILSIFVMMFINYRFFRKNKYDINTSLLSSLPGGISTTLLLADSIHCNRNAVVISQIIRYLAAIFLFPIIFLITFLLNNHGNIGNIMHNNEYFPIIPQILLIICSFIVLLVVRRFYKVTPIIFAILFGTAIYSLGLTTIHIDSLMKAVAQIFIGWLAGCQLDLKNISNTKFLVKNGIKTALLASFIAIVFAIIATKLFDVSFMDAALCFSSGGSDAMLFLAITFKLDILLISVHQIIRIVFLDFFIMFLSNYLIKKQKS